MQKKFNITGICRPAKHYMADVSGKLAKILAMVEDGDYFVINRPRQYGKTTTLYTLAELLERKGNYLVFNISFEPGFACLPNLCIFLVFNIFILIFSRFKKLHK